MHELSIALSILEGVEEEVTQHGYGPVEAIHVRIGALSGVVPQALLSAFELAREGTRFSESLLTIEDSPVVIRCYSCGTDGLVESIQWMICPTCAQPASEIVAGRELEVVALELAP
jgi:hydrogenase nickel incorporation protein HypA/HybF